MLSSFLESGSGMEGGSDLIIGIVAQMKETTEADLAGSICEDSAISSSASPLARESERGMLSSFLAHAQGHPRGVMRTRRRHVYLPGLHARRRS